MNTFTRIGLPILLVAGVVFGITFIKIYSGGEEEPIVTNEAKGSKAATTRELPLKFATITAGVTTAQSTPKHLQLWDSEVEFGAPGHYGFWCENRNDKPVHIRVPSTNCQCAGVEMTLVTSAAHRELALLSALGSTFSQPGGSLSAPLAAIAHARFNQSLDWVPLYTKEGKVEQTLPAADPTTGPQFGIVKLTWSGKGDNGKKTIAAQVYASIGEGAPSATDLSANISVVPAFEALRHNGSQWEPLGDVALGDLRENGSAKHALYFASHTRPFLHLTATLDRPDPCVSVSDPQPASPAELMSLNQSLASGEDPLRRAKSLYRVEVTVRERTEVNEGGRKVMKQLDLGALDRRLTFTTADAGSIILPIRGRIQGEIAFLAGADTGRIELGNAFAAGEDRVHSVTLVAERAGLELQLLEAETMPNYLKVKLESMPPMADGRKQWRLRVTLPKNSLVGAMPPNSNIYLQTNGSPPRRLRLPVRGMTYDTGGPRL